VDLLVHQSFYSDQLPSITAPQTSSPTKDYIQINLDSDLNATDLENLQDMSFDLPRIVFMNRSKKNLIKLRLKIGVLAKN